MLLKKPDNPTAAPELKNSDFAGPTPSAPSTQMKSSKEAGAWSTSHSTKISLVLIKVRPEICNHGVNAIRSSVLTVDIDLK